MRKARKNKYIRSMLSYVVLFILGLSVSGGSLVIGLILTVVGSVGAVYCFFKRTSKSLDAWELCQIYMSTVQLKELSSGKMPIIEYSDITLKKNEKCHYACYAERLITSRRVVSYSNTSTSTRTQIAKGLSVSSSRGTKKPIRADVTDRFRGTFIITNMRILFLAKQKGFDLKYNDITAFLDDDMGLELQAGQNYYVINVVRPQYPRAIIKAYLKASNT